VAIVEYDITENEDWAFPLYEPASEAFAVAQFLNQSTDSPDVTAYKIEADPGNRVLFMHCSCPQFWVV